jgi:hypothetical protein
LVDLRRLVFHQRENQHRNQYPQTIWSRREQLFSCDFLTYLFTKLRLDCWSSGENIDRYSIFNISGNLSRPGNYKTRGMETPWTSKENLFTMFALVDVLIKLFYCRYLTLTFKDKLCFM